MKVKSNKNEFSPFDVTITVETKEEAQALYAVFNHTDNSRLFQGGLESLRSQFKEYGSPYGESIIANGVTYNKFYGN
jgi:hypothetical protein